MTENEKIELFDKWYDENYDEWAEGEEGIALREELEQAFKGGIADLEKENAELKEKYAKKADTNHSLVEQMADLENENAKLKERNAELRGMYVHSAREAGTYKQFLELKEKENAELRKIAEFQQSSNMSRHFENKKLKEGLAVGSTFNKALNSMNKALEEERDKYRNIVFDKDDQLTKAKEIIKTFLAFAEAFGYSPSMDKFIAEAEQFLNEVEK